MSSRYFSLPSAHSTHRKKNQKTPQSVIFFPDRLGCIHTTQFNGSWLWSWRWGLEDSKCIKKKFYKINFDTTKLVVQWVFLTYATGETAKINLKNKTLVYLLKTELCMNYINKMKCYFIEVCYWYHIECHHTTNLPIIEWFHITNNTNICVFSAFWPFTLIKWILWIMKKMHGEVMHSKQPGLFQIIVTSDCYRSNLIFIPLLT